MSTSKSNFWSSPLTKSRITSDDVKMPEMLLGYFIGPFGALLSSGIFTSISAGWQKYSAMPPSTWTPST